MLIWLLSPAGIAYLTLTGALALVLLVKRGWPSLTVVLLLAIGLFVGAFKVTAIPLPKDIRPPRQAIVYDRNGVVLGSLGNASRIFVDIAKIPEQVRNAVIAAEDHDFYEHGGVSIPAMLRASLADLFAGRIVQGGSTITQQYVKNALLEDNSRTVVRKLKEAVLAVKLEDRYTKEQILGFYLNTIYFGAGAYGIEAAARTYFDKHVGDLTNGEAALLAGIIRSPENLRPDRYPAKARERRDSVLASMVGEGFISDAEAREASSVKVDVPAGRVERSRKVNAAFFLEWVRRTLAPEFGECLYRCGLKIHTTLDLRVQRVAEATVERALPSKNDPKAALAAVTPDGGVIAMVGGRPFSSPVAASGFNLAADRPGRQAGSTLKPFALAAAIEEGLSAATVLDGSSPATISRDDCRENGKPWEVENYGGSSYGSVTLASATSSSINTAYARVVDQIGPEPIADALSGFGFGGDTGVPVNCSLVLGALDVTVLGMAHAYAGLAGGGSLAPLTPVSYVEADDGTCIHAWGPRSPRDCEIAERDRASRALPADVAEQVTIVLRGVLDHGTAAGVDADFDAAGKTGTSQNNTDAWFAGYTDDLAAAVWIGYRAEEHHGKTIVPQMRVCDDRVLCRPVRGGDATGGSIPAEMWADFMGAALKILETDKDPEVSTAAAPQPVSSEQDAGSPGPSKEDAADSEPSPPAPAESPPDQGLLPIDLPTPRRAGGAVQRPYI